MLTYDGRRFTPVGAGAGEAFGTYHQTGDLISVEIEGIGIRVGRLVGTCDSAGVIEAGYCQVMADGAVVSGRCTTTPTLLPDGRLRLSEQWQRIDGSSGVSVIEEVA